MKEMYYSEMATENKKMENSGFESIAVASDSIVCTLDSAESKREEEAGRCEAPLISVIVPVYNVEKYVRKCLDSLLNQTMKQIEVICIDDGSTDESGRIADEYENEVGWPRFRVIHTENRGLSVARNRGIDEGGVIG